MFFILFLNYVIVSNIDKCDFLFLAGAHERDMNFTDSELVSEYLHRYFPDLEKDEGSYESAFLYMLKINTKTFCDSLKRYREERGFTQSEISNALDVTQSTYSAWETGRYLPKADSIKRISNILDIDPIYLICSKIDDFFGETSIPILPPGFFVSLSFDNFDSAIREYESYPLRESVSVLKSMEYDFAFRVPDQLMRGERICIPKDSYLFCEKKSFEGKSKIERFRLAHGNVAIVSYKGYRGAAREISYSDSTQEVSLIIWNTSADLKKLSSIDSIHFHRNRQEPLLVKETYPISEVEIYGIVMDCHIHVYNY